MSEHGAEEFDWEGAEDLTALSEEELKERLEGLVEEERAVSYRREILRGRIDLIRAELVNRGAVALSPEELVRVLLNEPPEEERRS
jgi:anti-sigma-K factor RsiG